MIFNERGKIFDKIPETNKEYFTACPAESAHELEFNQTKSITKNSLFLRDTIVVPAEHNTSLVECEHSYKTSILFNEEAMIFGIGYEVLNYLILYKQFYDKGNLLMQNILPSLLNQLI